MVENMMPLLLAVGALIIVAAAFFWVRSGRANNRSAQAQTVMDRTELEQVMRRFVHQVKQENEHLIANLQRKNDGLVTEVTRLQKQLETLQSELDTLKESFESSLQLEQQSETAAAAMNNDTLFLKNRYKRVFELRQEGLQAEEIAKRLGAGQGEIALILSLAAAND